MEILVQDLSANLFDVKELSRHMDVGTRLN